MFGASHSLSFRQTSCYSSSSCRTTEMKIASGEPYLMPDDLDPGLVLCYVFRPFQNIFTKRHIKCKIPLKVGLQIHLHPILGQCFCIILVPFT